MTSRTPARRPREEASWDLVLKRNPVERLKREKAPLGIRDELPALIAAGLRERGGGGHRPPAVVGPLPRQAEGRHLHAAREAAGGSLAGGKLRAIGEVANLFGARRRRALDAPEHPAALARAREAAGGLRAPRGGRNHERRRLRRHRAQHHRLPRPGDRRTTSCSTRRRSSTRRPRLLRQPRVGEPAAQAQVLDRRLRRPLQRAGDQLRLARRRGPRGPRGLRGPRRRRPLVGAADRPRHGRVRAEGGGERDPRRDHRRLVGGPQVPRLAGQGPAQVHGRRHRRRGHARARRGAARPHARGPHAAARRGRAARPLGDLAQAARAERPDDRLVLAAEGHVRLLCVAGLPPAAARRRRAKCGTRCPKNGAPSPNRTPAAARRSRHESNDSRGLALAGPAAAEWRGACSTGGCG